MALNFNHKTEFTSQNIIQANIYIPPPLYEKYSYKIRTHKQVMANLNKTPKKSQKPHLNVPLLVNFASWKRNVN